MTPRKVTTGIFVLLLAGCTHQVVHEELTPRGQVPPPGKISGLALTAANREAVPPPARATTQEMAASQPTTDSLLAGSPHRAFGEAYARTGSPRMVVYINRELSAEVREWRTDKRIVASGDGSLHDLNSQLSASAMRDRDGAQAGVSGSDVRLDVESRGGDAVFMEQQHLGDTARQGPGEAWMWEFEEGFITSLLQSGVTVVDRTVILRNTRHAEQTGSKMYDLSSVRSTEAQALTKYADILVELLVSPSATAIHGYEFRAVAKDIRTGQILGVVSTTGQFQGQSIRATDSGFVMQDGSASESEVIATPGGFERRLKFPTVGDASADLAEQLKYALQRSWAMP